MTLLSIYLTIRYDRIIEIEDKSMLTNRLGYGVELELDYGRVVAPYPVIKSIFDNWMNQDCLSGLITEEIEVIIVLL